MRVWDLETEQLLSAIPTGTADCVTSMTSWPDGNTLAASCGDGSVRIFDKRLNASMAQVMAPEPVP